MKEFITHIDWELLRKQKQTLESILGLDNQNKLPINNQHIEGLLYLLDNLQDYAIDDYGMSEEVVMARLK